MTDYRSPLLDFDGAVTAGGVDEGIAWHYGDPLREQRLTASGAGLLDQSNRDVLVVPGPDRLEWLHAICSQHLTALHDGDSTEALVLSPNGHVEQHWVLTELGDQIWIDTEPGAADEALNYLLKMRFMKRVEPAVVTADFAVLSVLGPNASMVLAAAGLPVPDPSAPRAIALDGGGFVRPRIGGGKPGGVDLMLPRADLANVAARLRTAGAAPIGSWAAAAGRIEHRRPRLGFDTDHRTIPHEVGWIGTAVHLDKGCYRGQETVARVQNLGKPPRRIVLLYLSGENEQLPPPGTPIERDGRPVGFLGTAVHHYELGPIALAVLKRTVSDADTLTVAGQSAAIDPDDAQAQVQSGFAGRVGPAPTTA
ncbi:MAG TPA: folate-binding protein [Jatrophihabitans sp.]